MGLGDGAHTVSHAKMLGAVAAGFSAEESGAA